MTRLIFFTVWFFGTFLIAEISGTLLHTPPLFGGLLGALWGAGVALTYVFREKSS